MTRTEEIKKAADELYKDSEYPVPNIYSFMKGAEWADKNPLPAWRKFEEHKPGNDVPIIVAVIHTDFKIVSYEIMRFHPMKCIPSGKGLYRMTIPDIKDELMKPLFDLSENE